MLPRPFRPAAVLCLAAAVAVLTGCGNRAGKTAGTASATPLTPALSEALGAGEGNKPPAKRNEKIVDTTSPIFPDKTKTPGDTLPVTAADVCTSGYAGKVRNVPESVKKAVYLSYGITSRKPGQYEVDHLISLELGGSNSQKNLWPESFGTSPWNARVKDRLENELHDEVCDGKMTLGQAQKEIAGDWVASYKKLFHTDLPLATAKSARKHGGKPAPDASADLDDAPENDGAVAPAKPSDVWVNLKSGIYWQPGTRYYGKTSKGKYESEAAAKKEGFRAAKD